MTKVEVNFWSVFKIVFAAQTDLQILNVIYNVTLQYGLLSLQSLGNTYNGENKLACGHKVSDWNIFVLLRCQNKTFIIMSLSYFGFSGHSLCKWEILLKCFSNFQIRNYGSYRKVASTEMRWLFISSSTIWVAGWDNGSDASRARMN